MDQPVYHIPALLEQCMDALALRPGGIYVDATYGGGGHSHEILARIGRGRLYAFDQDEDAINRAEKDERLIMIHGNFRFLTNYLRYYGVQPGEVDGILADLGVSFHHFDEAERGFSFRMDGPLDMRMNRASSLTAATLLADCDESKLAEILHIYGELKSARRIAAAIVSARQQSPIDTTTRLLQVVQPLINPKQEKKELAQIYQALRIAVNDEMGALRQFLQMSVRMLRPGGRLAIITYHSLEDRLVKNFMKTGNIEGREEKDFYGRRQGGMKLITNKPIVPDDAEIERNPRSRSAKLRVAEKPRDNDELL